MKNIINRIVTLAAIIPVLALGLIAIAPLTVSAEDNDPDTTTCSTAAGAKLSVGSGSKCAKTEEQKWNLGNVIQDITEVLLFIIGAVAVIMIIIGGIRYVISGGDSSQVQAAKNTILYALVGVIVAILAYAAVNFVVASFVPESGGGSDGGGSWSGSAVSPR